MARSYSMHVHHPPQSDGDSYHLVALKSSTLGSLQLDPTNSNEVLQIRTEPVRQNDSEKDITEFSVGVIDAKTWSKMIEENIPKFVPRTPVTTPPGEPETINAWELMEGLDDTSPLRPKSATNHIRSFSFHVNAKFRKSLELLPPAFYLKPPVDGKLPEPAPDGCGEDDSLEFTDSKISLQNGFINHGRRTRIAATSDTC
ncbi:hypothetical protein L1987_36615 [Smallanthus sonchifolius]|uniref:Uncharacterized protein n=1 Tax=Smallanthus sonchifolius TaxID=185202 RepID=A0ACB9HFG1_9ASTR|nr:hypothetical protein L1987_36615 [Smallanthus sonchifolius]